MHENYLKYRGKCKELCEQLIESRSDLTLVRGYYYEPLWNREEQHWWCEDDAGNIVDPSKDQFPTKGVKSWYRKFTGVVNCEQCGKEIQEEDITQMGNYPTCSYSCALRLVGL